MISGNVHNLVVFNWLSLILRLQLHLRLQLQLRLRKGDWFCLVVILMTAFVAVIIIIHIDSIRIKILSLLLAKGRIRTWTWIWMRTWLTPRLRRYRSSIYEMRVSFRTSSSHRHNVENPAPLDPCSNSIVLGQYPSMLVQSVWQALSIGMIIN